MNVLIRLSCFVFLLAFSFSCSEDDALNIEDSSQNKELTSETDTTGKKVKNKYINAVVNIGGYISSPLDGTRAKVVLDTDGTTSVTWKVEVRRSSTSEDINQEFILTNGFPTWSKSYGSIYIRTVDMRGSLNKTFTITSTITGSPSKVSVVSRNYLTTPATTFESASYSTVSSGNIEAFSFPAGNEQLDEGRGYEVKWTTSLISSSQVKLSLYRNGVKEDRISIRLPGSRYSTVFFGGTTDPLANSGTQRWYAPSVPSSGAERYGWKIKVENADDPSQFYFSEEFQVIDDE